jgi:hypothetical protein
VSAFWSNDFARKVKPLFDFLVAQGYRLIHEEISSSFDNGVLVYQSDHLRVEVVRDRGDVWFSVSAPGHERSVDQEILGLMLIHAEHYARAEPVQEDQTTWSAGFLRANLSAIEQLFAPGALSHSVTQARVLQDERVDHFVRGRSDR